jgi:hypothetical protein
MIALGTFLRSAGTKDRQHSLNLVVSQDERKHSVAEKRQCMLVTTTKLGGLPLLLKEGSLSPERQFLLYS